MLQGLTHSHVSALCGAAQQTCRMAGRTALAAAFTRCINGLLGKQRSACIPVLKELLRLHVRRLAVVYNFKLRLRVCLLHWTTSCADYP